MTKMYFGTDGIRGRVGQTPITPEFVMRLGYSAGIVLVEHKKLKEGEHPVVIIGKDTRVSGYMLEAALEAGLAAAGVDVMLAGPLPTPAVAYLTRALRLQAGIVISASHNPYFDNGIKFFSAGGVKLPDTVESEIEERMTLPVGCADSTRLGRAMRISDAAGRYIEFCKSTFPNDLDLRGLKITVDCAHGAAYNIAPKIFHELGAEVNAIGTKPDGFNINDRVGSTVPESVTRAVLAHGSDFGISLDGDGDRLLMCDRNGVLYDGDQLLYVIARHQRQFGAIDGVVGTQMSNLGLEKALNSIGIPFDRAKVGDRYVLERLQFQNWKLGGENSGHIICLDRHSTGDGIVSALQVLAALIIQNESLAEACAGLALFPQKLINVRVPKGFDWGADRTIQDACAEVERELESKGRLLLRSSGTEPVLRVMVEAFDADLADRLVTKIAGAVRSAIEG